MNFFYFNDCISKNEDNHLLVSCLQNTLKEYNEVKKVYPDEVDGIITEKEPDKTILNLGGYTLTQCINDLEPQSKRFAYSVFNKFPIENVFSVNDENKLLEGDFSLVVNGVELSAINLVIANENEGVLFTLALHNDLKKDKLKVSGSSDFLEINNLFGETLNTDFIKKEIGSKVHSKLGNFEKLLAIVGNNLHSDRFLRGFNNSTKIVQESIIEHFQYAKDRNGDTNFYSDEELIKDVTPAKELKVKVYELRIFKPVAYRVYFYETEKKVYLAMIEKKPAKKVQTTHITSSKDIIKELIIKESL